MSGPRSNMSQMNGNNRRPPSNTNNLNRVPSIEKPTCAQHDDLIKYICESWNKISQEADKSSNSSTIKYYCEQESHMPKDFEPFNLEAYWGRKEVQKLQQPQHS
ncbi:uncharacterized protein [Atheta coriaria]|uniref:uncharacterized protein n=1 Tax=Dalotia coriaria TaxID=877792 RepID=UPI0031F44968